MADDDGPSAEDATSTTTVVSTTATAAVLVDISSSRPRDEKDDGLRLITKDERSNKRQSSSSLSMLWSSVCNNNTSSSGINNHHSKTMTRRVVVHENALTMASVPPILSVTSSNHKKQLRHNRVCEDGEYRVNDVPGNVNGNVNGNVTGNQSKTSSGTLVVPMTVSDRNEEQEENEEEDEEELEEDEEEGSSVTSGISIDITSPHHPNDGGCNINNNRKPMNANNDVGNSILNDVRPRPRSITMSTTVLIVDTSAPTNDLTEVNDREEEEEIVVVEKNVSRKLRNESRGDNNKEEENNKKKKKKKNNKAELYMADCVNASVTNANTNNNIDAAVDIFVPNIVVGVDESSGDNRIDSNNFAVDSHRQGSPFKGQVRMAEDTLTEPCGKKRCADRYDSSESSDSGVTVSCGECSNSSSSISSSSSSSSSGTSDITEPGSPCSTSSDEGVGIRGASASPLLAASSPCKLAPTSQTVITRPSWPWTPPLAATACRNSTTYKRLKGEPEAGALPRSGAAGPSSRGPISLQHKSNNGGKICANGNATVNAPLNNGHHHNPNHNHHHHHHHHHHHSPHETQGKITEYFKTQIKPQQPKIKKSSETMSVLVAKSTSEFRRPPTVQRNKGGLAKYLGTMSPNNRDWDMKTLSMSPPPTKKPSCGIVSRSINKTDKKPSKPISSNLSISNNLLKNLPSCKISSLRLTSDASPSATIDNSLPPSKLSLASNNESTTLDFKGCILSKQHVNENNNLTNGCINVLGSTRSHNAQQESFSRLSSVPSSNDSTKIHEKEQVAASPIEEDDVDVEEEEEDSRDRESKIGFSPILATPTTIRFPAQAMEKDRSSQITDSGICRWDKCGANFESVTGLLEHLQAAHINTQTGGDNFVCQWQGCKVQGRTSCSRRWLERHVLSHGGNKPFRCIVDGCGSRFSSQTALERHVNGHFNQSETSSNSGRRSCENGGKLVRRNGKKLRYRRQPWSARIFDYFDSGVMEGLQHRLLELAKSRTQGRIAETPGDSMALTSQVMARRVELDGKIKVLLRWYPPNIEPDEWVLESEVQSTKNVGIRKVANTHPEEVNLALYPAINGGTPPLNRVKQRRKPVKNS